MRPELKKALLSEYENRKRKLLEQISLLEKELEKKESDLTAKQLAELKKAEERLSLIEKRLTQLTELQKTSLQTPREKKYVIEFEDGTKKEFSESELLEHISVSMADTTSAAVSQIQPTVWIVGRKVKVKDKVGKIKRVKGPKSYIIEFEDGGEITVGENELKAADFAPFEPVTPLKPAPVYNKNVFYDLKKLLEVVNPETEPYIVEEKFDGFRAILHKKGNKVRIYSDQKRDITDAFPTIVEQAKKLTAEDIILDGELVPYNEKGESLGRRGLMEFIGAIKSGKKLDDSHIKYHVFDILYYKNQSLDDARLYERKKVLNLLNFTKNIVKVPFVVVHTKDELEKAVKLFRALPRSEGAMIKAYNSTYPLTGETPFWIKFRNVRDIYVKVLDVLPVKGANAWRYECGVKIPESRLKEFDPEYIKDGYMTFGNTFNTSIKAKKGDILSVSVQEIWRHEGKNGIHYSWHKPRVRFVADRKETSTIEDLDAIVDALGVLVKEMTDEDDDETRGEYAEEFWKNNWWKFFPESGKGEFVYHHHFRGLSKEEAEWDEEKLLETNHSLHGDLRLQHDERLLYGFTVFLGKTEYVRQGRDLWSLKEPDKLQGTWKLPQPKEWLYVAREKPHISKPAAVGATSKKYAKFFAEDWGTYEIGVWREHAFEFFIHGKKIKGRYLIVYAPVGEGGRKWLIGKPADQTPYAEKHDLEEVVKELKSKGQKWLVWAKPGSKPILINVEEF